MKSRRSPLSGACWFSRRRDSRPAASRRSWECASRATAIRARSNRAAPVSANSRPDRPMSRGRCTGWCSAENKEAGRSCARRCLARSNRGPRRSLNRHCAGKCARHRRNKTRKFAACSCCRDTARRRLLYVPATEFDCSSVAKCGRCSCSVSRVLTDLLHLDFVSCRG